MIALLVSIAAILPAHTGTTQNHRCTLTQPRVNQHRGHWNARHDLLTWNHGQITFDGIQFWNGSNQVIRATARCAP